MKPNRFEYSAPRSVAEAVAELAEHGADATVLAGGQSLLALLNLRVAAPARLVDVMRIEELRVIGRRDGVVEIGAGVRQAEAERQVDLPLLRDALRHVGHPATRNAGTICGSLAHADPAAELPAVALALEAEVVLRSAHGERIVAAADFFRGVFTTAREPDELVTAVRLPAPGGRAALAEVTPRRGSSTGEFATAGVVVVRSAESASIALFGVAEVPVRARAAETLLVGESPSPGLHAEAAERAADDLDPPSDVHASGEYRRRLVRALTRQVLDELAA